MPSLFDQINLRDITVRNRIGLSPMSLYSGVDGEVSTFDLVHYGARAIGGAGLIFTGSVAVAADGRITPGDPGIWTDSLVNGLAGIARVIREAGATPGIQLGHAGRKASTTIPWRGGEPKSEGRDLTDVDGGWETMAPSPIAFGGNRGRVPREMSVRDIQNVVEQFAAAAKRADEAGFDVLQLHAGHGYLLHQFYSPFTNKRTDAYGGSFENRIRLLREAVHAVRDLWPQGKPLVVRLTIDDYLPGGWTSDEAIKTSEILMDDGVDMIDLMSFGGLAPGAEVPWGTDFTVAHAEEFRNQSPQVPVTFSAQTAIDFHTAASDLDELVVSGCADMVLLGRQLLIDPHFPVRLAGSLGQEQQLLPSNYEHWLSGQSNGTEFVHAVQERTGCQRLSDLAATFEAVQTH